MSDNSWYEKGELPPVGEEVEAYIYNGAEGLGWLKRRVLGYGAHSRFPNNKIIVDSGQMQFDIVFAENFRPIKSDREKAIEAMLALDCDSREGMLSRHDFCGAIYDAGYRKDDK